MTISIDAPLYSLLQGVGLLAVILLCIWAASKAGDHDPKPAVHDPRAGAAPDLAHGGDDR
jgi:hypothetical protein